MAPESEHLSDRIMTTLGRQRPSFLHFVCALGLCAGLAAGVWQSSGALAATTEQIVVDRNSGLAIYGFDPVAYFTDGKAMAGDEGLELNYGGAAWRFKNEGNLAAFENDPEVYMPQFGGYDPTAVSQGVPRPGHPEFFAVHNQRLFLFASAEAKQAFEADPDGMALQAEANWPDVSKTLVP